MNDKIVLVFAEITSKRRVWKAAVVLLLSTIGVVLHADAVAAQGSLDRVRRRNGADSGQVTAISPLGVTISKGGVESKIPVEEIEDVTFAGEPRAVTAARQAIAAGRIDSALESLEGIRPTQVPREGVRRDGVLSEIDYLKAASRAQLAIAGRGEADEALQSMRGFLASHNRSFRVPAAIELLGDVLSAAGDAKGARAQYEKLAKAKTPYFVARSALLAGRSLQQQDAHEQAVERFGQALAVDDASPAVAPIRREATLGRAVSQAALGKLDESATRIAEGIAAASDDDHELLAQAYNALGDCYLAADRPQDALFAFLHVDLLYADADQQHAKALHQLSELWKSAGYADRAAEAKEKLADQYANSRWNRP